MRALGRALLPLLASIAGCTFYVHREYRPLGSTETAVPVEDVREVSVRNNVGHVVVEAAEVDVVTARVAVYTKASPETVPGPADPARDLLVVREGDRLRIENAHLDGPDPDDWKMDITVTVPASVDVRITNGVGDCEVSGTSGRVEIDLGVGDLEVRAGRLAAGAVKTGVGDVDVRVAEEGPDEALECESGVGSVAIILPASFEGEVDLATGVGSLRVRGASGLELEKSVVGGSARGRIGTGAARVRARTGTGDLTLERSEG